MTASSVSPIINEYEKKIPEMRRKMIEALAEASRRTIMTILMQERKGLSFKEILDILKPMNTSTLNHHLKILMRAGMVENIYQKSEEKHVYSIYRPSELGEDIMSAFLLKH
jgi:DNA-binding HxlR family transcriptional regulator